MLAVATLIFNLEAKARSLVRVSCLPASGQLCHRLMLFVREEIEGPSKKWVMYRPFDPYAGVPHVSIRVTSTSLVKDSTRIYFSDPCNDLPNPINRIRLLGDHMSMLTFFGKWKSAAVQNSRRRYDVLKLCLLKIGADHVLRILTYSGHFHVE